MPRVWKRSSDKSKPGSRWYVTWADWRCTGGQWREKQVTQLAFTDKAESYKLGVVLEERALKKRMGLIDEAQEQLAAQLQRPITEHLDGFIEHITARGRDDRYVRQLRPRLERFFDHAGIGRLADVTADGLDKYVLHLRRSELSGYTINEVIGTARAFTKWAVYTRRLAIDPLACVRKLESKKLTKKRLRRAMTTSEIAELLKAARHRPEYELRLVSVGSRKGELTAKVSDDAVAEARRLGDERALAYLLAIWTGLLRSELVQIQWGDIELDTLPHCIRLRAATTKSKRADTVTLHPEIAEALRVTRPEDATSSDTVLTTVPGMRTLKADLKAAGVEFETDAGRADLHAMRKSLATMLAAHGVGQRIAQSHLRHTDPRLTANIYTDESILPVAASLAALPYLGTKAG